MIFGRHIARCKSKGASVHHSLLLKLLRPPFRALRLQALFSVLASALVLHGQAYRVRPQPPPKSDLALFGAVSVSASPSSLNFALVPRSTAMATAPVSITTTWQLLGVAPTLNLYAYFTNPHAALGDDRVPPDVIPSSAVLGQMIGGAPAAFTPFTEAVPASTAGLILLKGAAASNFFGSRTDVLRLEINLSSLPDLPAGTYTGTLTLQATIM